jgi:two-component system, LuxR family, response regulator FixJ
MSSVFKQPTVFVLDDEPKVAKAIGQTVASLSCTVRCFTSGSECLNELRTSHCDLLITDVNMPGMDGLQLLEEAKRIRPLLPVLMVSGYGDIPIAIKAVKRGALDFIQKPLDESTFLPLVREALTLAQPADSDEAKAVTEAEREVLRLIVAGKTNKEIAFALERSSRTVENHRHRLMRKLNVSSPAELVKAAIRLGLVSPEE